MVRRSIRVAGPDRASAEALTARFAAVRHELGIARDFPPEVLAAAEQAAARPVAPDADLTAIPFVTVDPPGSTDLDQALLLARREGPGGGFVVHYAIADVPAFVAPGGPVDAEARRRGQTLYAPDARTPLHPAVLSEGAASLLPDVDRPAFVWRFELGATGEVESFDVVRALVRSRARLDYDQVQAMADGATAARRPEPAAGGTGASSPADPEGQAVLLREIGVLRLALERARGGASLPLPEQEVVAEGGTYRLQLRPGLPAEDWNAQLSLMTGMAAGRLMLDAGTGLLRTLPPPDDQLVARFRRQAAALGVTWPGDLPYGAFLAGLDRDDPAQLALLHEAGSLFRGAGYTPLPAAGGTRAGTATGPGTASTLHAAVAAPYAHVTAPLRRLVDRFGLVAAHALCRGEPVPDWVVEALPSLPAVMAASDQLAGRLERACLDAVEAAVLAARVGETFEAVVVDVTTPKDGGPVRGKVQLLEPAVLATCDGPLELGSRATVRLEQADLASGTVRFSAVGPAAVRG